MTKTIHTVAKALQVLLLSSALVVMSAFGFATADLNEAAKNAGLSGSYLAARVALDDNDDAAAVTFLERAISFDSENTRLRRDYFTALTANGRIEEAASILNEAPQITSKLNLAGFTISAVEIRKRSWKKASSALKDITGAELERILREVMLAWISAGERNFDEAFARLEDLSGSEWILALKDYHGGLIASVAGKDELAKDYLQNVIDKDVILGVLTETYLRAIEAMVRNRIKVGDVESARSLLENGLTKIPEYAPFIQLKKNLDENLVLTGLIKTTQEGTAELFYNLASAIQRDSNGETAKIYYQIAQYLAPESDEISIGLAELYLRQRNFERSNSFYEKVDETSPFYRLSRLEISTNLARLDRKDEAIEELQRLIEENPNDLTGYMALGSILSREKRYREAAETYDNAVSNIDEFLPFHWDLFFRRGIAYERLKEWQKAEPSFQRSLELSANRAEVLNYLGYSWIDQGVNLDEGMDMIRRAVQLRPKSGFIIDSLGWAYYRIGEYEKAVRELERAVQLMPSDPTINDHLGDAYWQVGRKLEATFQWKIALAAETPPEDPEEIERKLKEGLKKPEKNEAKAQ